LVDALTLTIAATIVQTVVITLTLAVFILQFRSQEKAIREASYQNLMGRYNDFIMTRVSQPEFVGFIARRMRSATSKQPSDKIIAEKPA
jgi:hypothetical protein